MRHGIRVLSAVALVLGPFAANAELHDRGGGMIYDDVLDVTWLQDANYAMTSRYDADGRMTWDQAVQWAATLTYRGYDDWRLPTVSPANGSQFVYGDLASHPSNSYSGLTDVGFNVAGTYSELGYMFYVNLGNKGYYSTTGAINWDWDNLNSGPFYGLQHYFYWVGTEYVHSPENFPTNPTYCAPPASCAWDFVIGYGDQTIYNKQSQFYAWAVRDGDVEPVNEYLLVDQLSVGGGVIVATICDFDRPFQIADDFTINRDKPVAITKVEWVGLRSPQSTVDAGDPAFDHFAIRFFRSVDGRPETTPFADLDVTAGIVERVTYNGVQSVFSLTLATPVELPNGDYFISIVADSRDYAPDDWTWYFRNGATMSYYRAVDGTDWAPRDPLSYSFRLFGAEITILDPAAMLERLAGNVAGVGPGKSLADKVVLAQTYYAVPDVQATCAMLTDFNNEVRAQRGKKIAIDVADGLTADAQAIVGAIGCE
jgi:hypothetical protein